jgi:hypothetical protein
MLLLVNTNAKMKRTLLISLLLLSVIFTVSADRRRSLMTRNVASAASARTVNVWETFDFSSLTTGNLEANDNAAGTWTITGAAMSTTNAAERQLFSPNSIGDDAGGTHGLAWSVASANSTYIYHTLAASAGTSPVTMSFWLYVPGFTNAYGQTTVAGRYALAQVNVNKPSATTNSVAFSIKYGGLYGTASTSVSENSWYWISFKMQRNATCSMRVYDSSGVALATQPGDVTGANSFDMDSVWIGAADVNNAPAGPYVFYFDDIEIDSADATFPLGP